MKKSITIVEGGSDAKFLIGELISHFKKEKINYIIIGAKHIILENHPKPNSLDVWLRHHESVALSYKNTCQAVTIVIDDILEYEQFSIGKGKCPTTNKICKALIFDNSDAK
jgi:hypothetical protein